MDKTIVARPVSCQIELAWGCNRRCAFCGIHALHLPLNKFEYMSSRVLGEVMDGIEAYIPHCRLEMGTGGEPTAHPEFFSSIALMRLRAPNIQIMVQTNGELWNGCWERKVQEFWAAGGNILAFNCYQEGLFEKITANLAVAGIEGIDYYKPGNELTIYRNYNKPRSTRMVFLYRNYENEIQQKGISSSKWINNQGGATPLAVLEKLGKVKSLPLKAMCTRPYREIIVNWDGRVPVCCYDWTDCRIVGDLLNQSMAEIWEGDQMDALRAALRLKNRTYTPCDTCDMPGGFRQGLVGATGWDRPDDPVVYLQNEVPR